MAAAHTDPDTYAPAKLDSVDPVAQVSVSVIGEGVLQLRGPINGINQIRTMLDEIDSPLGQVKVDIITVQVNGEKGNKMEKPVGMIAAHLGLGRFLTAQSLMYLRRAVQMEAARIAVEADQGGHYQVDRDRKYLYSFFGRDFTDELYEMDSEFLKSENKVLSLHSMDTLSLHRALFMLALAKNDVRERILADLIGMVQSELPQAEFDYRRSSELVPYKTRRWLPHHDHPELDECTFEAVQRNALNRYHFTNLRGFFSTFGYCGGGDSDVGDPSSPDTMNPMQREFIRLAQIYKARMVAELELNQRIVERAMVEDDRERSIEEEGMLEQRLRPQVLNAEAQLQQARFDASGKLADTGTKLEIELAHDLPLLDQGLRLAEQFDKLEKQASDVIQMPYERATANVDAAISRLRWTLRQLDDIYPDVMSQMHEIGPSTTTSQQWFARYDEASARYKNAHDKLDTYQVNTAEEFHGYRNGLKDLAIYLSQMATAARNIAKEKQQAYQTIRELFGQFVAGVDADGFQWTKILENYQQLSQALQALPQAESQKLLSALEEAFAAAGQVRRFDEQRKKNRRFLLETRTPLDQKKLLDYLLDEKQQKLIDIKEGTRSHIAVLDNYLKRLAVALEDDFAVQFYEPAFVRIRRASRQWQVTFGQTERTSILTNNRAYSAVHPTATMEFDLPKRDILLVEAMKGAQALTQDMGALLNDPTFLAAFKMMGGGPAPTKVQNVLPGLPSQPDEQQMGQTQTGPQRPLGSSLESLIPDPAIYKFETGTGYEIRPVIQPDGDSIVYDFMYMYTTNVREPVRADEKHLGRVKQHFINTQVQTSSFELREVSRYQVALKAARTGQGVPLFQQIPVAGWLFRPLPSAESSIQENIILAQCVVYPTVFDLMGLRWAPSVVDLDHLGLRDSEHVVRGRNETINHAIFDITSQRVDEMLDVEHASPENLRPDLHRRHTQPSPYHPGGYIYDPAKIEDPTGNAFEKPDKRPADMRDPPYDRRFRRPLLYERVPGEGPMDGQDEPLPAPRSLERVPGDEFERVPGSASVTDSDPERREGADSRPQRGGRLDVERSYQFPRGGATPKATNLPTPSSGLPTRLRAPLGDMPASSQRTARRTRASSEP